MSHCLGDTIFFLKKPDSLTNLLIEGVREFATSREAIASENRVIDEDGKYQYYYFFLNLP